MLNEYDYSDSTLGIWFSDNFNGTLKFTSKFNNSATFQFDSKTRIPLQQWTAIVVSQYYANGKYVFAVSVNGTVEYTTLVNASDLENVKVYASDTFHPAQEGYIRNVYIATPLSGSFFFKVNRREIFCF